MRVMALPAALALLAGCTTGQDMAGARGQYSTRVADAALASGAPDMALRVSDLIIDRDPGNTSAWVSRGDALYAMGQLTKARAAYRTVIQLDPRVASAHIGLGRTLVRSDPRAAEAEFAKAVAQEPENIVALNNLGITRDLLGRHVEAQDAYRTALMVDPELADVKVNLGLSLTMSGRAAEAADLLRPLVEHADATQEWRNAAAMAMTLAGDRDGARLALDGIDSGKPAAAMAYQAPAPQLPAVAIRTAPQVPVARNDLHAPPLQRDTPAVLPAPSAPPVLAAIDAAPVMAAQARQALGKPVAARAPLPKPPPQVTRSQTPARIDWSVLRPETSRPEKKPAASAAAPLAPAPVVPASLHQVPTTLEIDGLNLQLGAAEPVRGGLWERLAAWLPNLLASIPLQDGQS